MAHYQSGGSLIGKIGSYLQIVSKDPRSTAFLPLAEAYRQVGLLDDALEAARLGTKNLPHFSPGYSTLGRVLGQMGRIDEAMSAFARALSIDRQSPSALSGLAHLHLIKGERDLARKILQEAAEFHPNDEHVRNMLAALDLPRPWDKLNVAVAETTSEETPTASDFDQQDTEQVAAESIYTATLAEIYVKQGLLEKAVGVYEEILRHDPHNESARGRLNELLDEHAAMELPAEPAGLKPVSKPDSPDADEPPMSVSGVTAPELEPVLARSALEILQGWLVAIRQRREHVH